MFYEYFALHASNIEGLQIIRQFHVSGLRYQPC